MKLQSAITIALFFALGKIYIPSHKSSQHLVFKQAAYYSYTTIIHNLVLNGIKYRPNQYQVKEIYNDKLHDHILVVYKNGKRFITRPFHSDEDFQNFGVDEIASTRHGFLLKIEWGTIIHCEMTYYFKYKRSDFYLDRIAFTPSSPRAEYENLKGWNSKVPEIALRKLNWQKYCADPYHVAKLRWYLPSRNINKPVQIKISI